MNSDDPDFEHQLLVYFAKDDWAARGFQPVTSIWQQIQPGGRANMYFEGVALPRSQKELEIILEYMREDGLLDVKQPSAEDEPSYFATDQGIYEASFDEPPFVLTESSETRLTDGSDLPADFVNDRPEPVSDDQPRPDRPSLPGNDTLTVDSTSWTGLPREGILSPDGTARLQTGLRLVDQAIQRFEGTNEERAQARAYFIAIQALAESPAPPADLIWQIISRASSVAGIASLFVSILALFEAVAH